jgi:hypothetical protein
VDRKDCKVPNDGVSAGTTQVGIEFLDDPSPPFEPSDWWVAGFCGPFDDEGKHAPDDRARRLPEYRAGTPDYYRARALHEIGA